MMNDTETEERLAAKDIERSRQTNEENLNALPQAQTPNSVPNSTFSPVSMPQEAGTTTIQLIPLPQQAGATTLNCNFQPGKCERLTLCF